MNRDPLNKREEAIVEEGAIPLDKSQPPVVTVPTGGPTAPPMTDPVTGKVIPPHFDTPVPDGTPQHPAGTILQPAGVTPVPGAVSSPNAPDRVTPHVDEVGGASEFKP